MRYISTSLRAICFFTLLCGVIYPLIVSVYAQLLFPTSANGSLIMVDGKPVGSELIGQNFTEAKYFHGRPSATEPPYNPGASASSHQNPAYPPLAQSITERLRQVRKENRVKNQLIPDDMLTASGSGLDPHISPEAAYIQLERVAKARGMKSTELIRLIEEHIEEKQFGFLGQRRINVLKLNVALDGL